MSIEVLAYVVLVCVLSGFAHGALGFGFPLVATPLVALVIDMRSAITLLAPLTLALVVISALRGGRLGELVRQFWFMPFGMAAGAWLGTRILLAAPPEPFLLVLALVLLVYLNLDRIGRGESPMVKRLRAPFGFAFAFLAGVSEAIANVAGPILFVYFMLLGAAPSQVVQTLNMCFTVGKGSQVLTLASAGALSGATWVMVAGLAVPSVAALAAGMRVRDRIDAQTYRAWLRKALWVMVVLLLLQFSRSVIAAEPLFSAIAQHRESAALELVGKSDLQACDANGDTALHRAVETGMQRLTHSLLAAGADPQARTRNGETALHLAALHPEPGFADLLLAAKADPRALNADGESPLHWAALSGHLVVAQRLLARGADARQKTKQGASARDYARREGHAEIVRLLERADQ